MAKGVPEEARRQGDNTQQQILGGTEVLGVAAAEGAGAHGEEGEADGRHHGGRHDGGDNLPPVLRQKAQGALHQAAYDDRAHQGRVAVVGGDGAEHRHKGEADAHDYRQLGPHLPDGIELDQRGDARHEHGVLQQDGHLSLAEGRLGGGGDEGDGGQVGDEHRQDVLEAEGNGLPQGDPPIQLVNVVDAAFRGLFCPVHRDRFLSPHTCPDRRRALGFHYMHKGRPLSNNFFVLLAKILLQTKRTRLTRVLKSF